MIEVGALTLPTNSTVTFLTPSIVTVHDGSATPTQAPPHLENTESVAAVAVRITCLPESKTVEYELPVPLLMFVRKIPAGLLVTLPVPVSDAALVTVSWYCTGV